MKKKGLLCLIVLLFLVCGQSEAGLYKDKKFGFKMSPPDSWKTTVYADGTDSVFEAMSPDGNTMLRVRGIELPGPGSVSYELLQKIYQKEKVSGASPYHKQDVTLNGVDGKALLYHWKYNGMDINVLAWFAILPEKAYIVTRIIPDVLLEERVDDVNKVLATFSGTDAKPDPVAAKPVPKAAKPAPAAPKPAKTVPAPKPAAPLPSPAVAKNNSSSAPLGDGNRLEGCFDLDKGLSECLATCKEKTCRVRCERNVERYHVAMERVAFLKGSKFYCAQVKEEAEELRKENSRYNVDCKKFDKLAMLPRGDYAEYMKMMKSKNPSQVQAFIDSHPLVKPGCYNMEGALKRCNDLCTEGNAKGYSQTEFTALCQKGCARTDEFFKDQFVWARVQEEKAKKSPTNKDRQEWYCRTLNQAKNIESVVMYGTDLDQVGRYVYKQGFSNYRKAVRDTSR